MKHEEKTMISMNEEYKAMRDHTISEAGGLATTEGRKITMMYALQDYLYAEIINSGNMEKPLNCFLQIIAHNISGAASNLSHNGLFPDKESAVLRMIEVVSVNALKSISKPVGKAYVITKPAKN